MSQKLFDRNPDLRRLREEGYAVRIRSGFLVMQVPYVDGKGEVRLGSLISSLTLAGDVTQRPDTHVVQWDGGYPCGKDGKEIEALRHGSGDFNLGSGLTAKFTFSCKPSEGYADYHGKMTTYAGVIAGAAAVLKPELKLRSYAAPEPEETTVFNYTETASDRAGIGTLADLLRNERVVFIGLGGTGAYALDLVAKTPVPEIRLIDGDDFLTHNAFRAPGAASLDELRQVQKKVDYLAGIYSKMHRNIVPHPVALDQTNLHLLDGATFAFICMDAGEAKKLAIGKCEEMGIPFVDVGMGLELVDGSLGGILRVTASTPEMRTHVHDGRISFGTSGDELNPYSTNIQVADLNALNAAMAVVKWKKIRGFYRDLEREHHSTYTTDGNMLLNGDQS
ncbi:ThiF family adenylyltransferase [Bradyrhizobium sp. CB1717]|uniref:ThiF family adenylyltransferase n=1 Tax=Bradyrhizobium sp. CB1717 TaxID=3039154 RepID=UPI0024B13B33|nr:ThiF family adenylyltransferase [Bradyrhizobium sp. CB1717]WFU24975.1 ThiF family adenylyltransferase [Bradyrhizobium sp. CB1717]